MRAWATGSSPTSARSTPSCSCCGRSPTTTSPAPTTRSSTCSIVELELALADLETVEKRLVDRRQKAAQARQGAGDRGRRPRRPPTTALSDGRPAVPGRARRRAASSLRPYFLLTNRRVLAVVNVGEDDLDRIRRGRGPGGGGAQDAGDNVEVLGMCVQLEAEAARLDDPTSEPRCSKGSASARGRCPGMVRSAYHLLGLRTFLTTGDKESRAWTFCDGLDGTRVRRPDPHRLPARLHPRRGDPVGRAARASVRGRRPRRLGKLRVEGKDYEVQDGDVMEIRFNV